MLNRFCLRTLCALILIVPTLSPGTAATPRFVSLETLTYDELCGLTTDGKTACIKAGTANSTWVPDATGDLKSVFANQVASCGFDAGGLKCWAQTDSTKIIDGLPQAQAFRKFLNEVDFSTVRSSRFNACGVESVSKNLRCLTPNWTTSLNTSFRTKLKSGLTALGLSENLICWADGLSSGEITCRGAKPSWKMPSQLKLAGVYEIAIGNEFICARSKTEGRCWTEGNEVALDSQIANSQQWAFDQDRFCALTQDQRIVCLDPATGTPSSSASSDVPAEFTKSNPLLKSLWTSEYNGCAALTDGTAVCWQWYSARSMPILFSAPLRELFGTGYNPCGLLTTGQVECRSPLMYESKSLRNTDRIRLEFGGYNKCFWNSTGVDCRGRVDAMNYTSIHAVTASTAGDSLCIIGAKLGEALGINTVQCFGYSSDIQKPPVDLTNPFAASVTDDKACALSDEGLTCWGAAYPGAAQPAQLSGAKKIILSSRHACGIDRFGFVCWGELDSLDLQIPDGLEQAGRVVDFALGTTRTCATLDDGTVKCWGRDLESSGAPPLLKGTKSLLGRNGLFCALDQSGVHCWGGSAAFPK